MSHFPDKLKSLRQQRGLTQSKLAEMVGRKQNTIGNWENGLSEPGIAELQKLADYFNISVDELLGRPELPARPKPYNQDAPPDSGRVEEAASLWIVVNELKRIDEKLEGIRRLLEHRPGHTGRNSL